MTESDARHDPTAYGPAPTVGRIVHVVRTERESGKPDVRPAIIVAGPWNDRGSCNLQVFNDGDGGKANDGLPNVTWETSIDFDAEKAEGTWHWPERS